MLQTFEGSNTVTSSQPATYLLAGPIEEYANGGQVSENGKLTSMFLCSWFWFVT